MKKILFLFATLLTTMVAGAQGMYITVKSGDLLELGQQKKMPIFVEFDYSKATINGKKTKEWVATLSEKLQNKFPDQITEAEDMFKIGLGNKYLACTGDKTTAKYQMKVTFGDFNPGKNSAASFLISNGFDHALMKTVNIDVYRTGEKEPCIVMEAIGVPGTGDTYSERRDEVYMIIGQEIGDLVKKEVKKAEKAAKGK